MNYTGIRCHFGDYDLHRELLLFDTIALPNLEAALRGMHTMANDPNKEQDKAFFQQRIADLEWLGKEGVVYVPPLSEEISNRIEDEFQRYIMESDQRRLKYAKAMDCIQKAGYFLGGMARALSEAKSVEELEIIDELMELRYFYLSRHMATELNQATDTFAIPIASKPPESEGETVTDRSNVLRIAFGAIPFPSESTPLEKLIDFRSDPEVRADYLALHHWSAEIAAKNRTQQEIREEAEYLVAQYDKHMKAHNVESNIGTFENIVITSAEMLEDIMKFKWGDAAKLIFSFSERKVKLLQAELDAPGRELAYIIKAREL